MSSFLKGYELAIANQKGKDMPLFISPLNVGVKIVKMLTDEKTKRHLMNLGLCVGSEVMVISHTPKDIIIKVLDTSLAINKDIAMRIIVA